MKKLRRIIFKVQQSNKNKSQTNRSKPCYLFKITKVTEIKPFKTTPKYVCSVCNKNCKSKISYNSHLCGHNRPRFQCHICHFVSIDKIKLAQHMRVAHMFKCNHCSMVFLCKKELNEHLNVQLIKDALMQNNICCHYNVSTIAKSSSSLKLLHTNRLRSLNKAEQVKEFYEYDSSTLDD